MEQFKTVVNHHTRSIFLDRLLAVKDFSSGQFVENLGIRQGEGKGSKGSIMIICNALGGP